MLYLHNRRLTISLLDPIKDQDRLGPRFCTGGYIYQVEDTNCGPLFCGPEFPAERPAVVNGQGLPEVFQFTLYNEEREIEEEKLIIGVGIVDKRALELPYHLFTNSRVLTFCDWQVFQSAERLRMETAQAYKQWSFQLTKEVLLHDRTITCQTRLRNIGAVPVPFRWFAHPFFPLTPDGRCCRFLMPASLPENPAYAVNANGFIEMKRDYNWREGFFQLIHDCQRSEFSAIQLHSQLNQIYVVGDFPLLKVAIWANDRTFSFEPFYEDTVPVDQAKAWSISYYF